MALKDTVKHLRDLLSHITTDLEKADNGNKAAAQRVRTGTVKLEKVAKVYRKESIKNEKTTKGQKKPAKKAASAAKHAPAKHAPAKHAAPKGKATAAASAKVKAKPKAMSFQRKATAKLPVKKSFFG